MSATATLQRANLPTSPEAIATALSDMLQSDGWALYVEMAREQFGPEAFERAVVESLMAPSVSAGDEKVERAVVSQVSARFRGAREALELPAAKVRVMKDAPKATAPAPFAKHRRLGIRPERATE